MYAQLLERLKWIKYGIAILFRGFKASEKVRLTFWRLNDIGKNKKLDF